VSNTGAGDQNKVTLTLPQALALAEQHMQAGRLAQAEQLCKDILRAQPNHAGALHLWGIVAYQARNLPAAIELVRRAIAADGKVALYHCNLGEMHRLAGQRDEALAAGRAALAIDPDLAQAHNNVGIVLYERDAFDEAIAHYRRATALAPGYAEAWSNLGNALRAQKKNEEALPAYRRARELRSDYADAISNMATALRDIGRLGEAEADYRRALALKPNDPNILNNLALLHKELEQFDEAAALLNRSLAVNASNVKTLVYLALIRLEQKSIGEAEAAATRALALAPDDAEALNAMGLIRYEQQRSEEAAALFTRALALKPDLADTHNNIGTILKENGKLVEAREEFVRAIELDPREPAYYFNLADAKKFAEGDAHLAAMEALARDTATLAPAGLMRLNFALGKAYDDLGRFADAFHCMNAGNALKRQRIIYDEAAVLEQFNRIRAAFDRKLLRKKPRGFESEVPVFVLGMPRSGTTLVEQILASHPAVHGAGELTDFSRLANQVVDAKGKIRRYPDDAAKLTGKELGDLGKAYVAQLRLLAPDAPRVTDKMPANFLYVGLIHLALPQARIIHVRRDPRDTCLSCYSKLFSAPQDFTYDLAELGRYYRQYDGLMTHWRETLPPGRMLEVRYEDVIDDLETWARRIVKHCGLKWDPACIAFHEARRPVRTASASQVRQPIYRTSEGRWRKYEGDLAPLITALGDIGRHRSGSGSRNPKAS
jgi:tetratricopeptide (TPR) repeat protein